MRSALKLICLLLLGLASGTLPAANIADTSVTYEEALTSAAPQRDQQTLQLRLNTLKQQVSVTTNYTQLVGLQDPVQDLIRDVDQRVASLLPEQAKIQAQLDVLGPVPTDDATMEKPDIAQQRSYLSARKSLLDGDLKLPAASSAPGSGHRYSTPLPRTSSTWMLSFNRPHLLYRWCGSRGSERCPLHYCC